MKGSSMVAMDVQQRNVLIANELYKRNECYLIDLSYEYFSTGEKQKRLSEPR